MSRKGTEFMDAVTQVELFVQDKGIEVCLDQSCIPLYIRDVR